MNLCNIHTHTNAEHKGPGFSMHAGSGEHGGYKCNQTSELTEANRRSQKAERVRLKASSPVTRLKCTGFTRRVKSHRAKASDPV